MTLVYCIWFSCAGTEASAPDRVPSVPRQGVQRGPSKGVVMCATRSLVKVSGYPTVRMPCWPFS